MGFGRNARRRHAVVHACETLGDTAPFYLGRVPPIVLAVANALLWAAWGEFYTRKRSTFAVGKFALVYGSVMLAAMIMTEILPAPVSNVFVALLPIACGAVYKAFAEGDSQKDESRNAYYIGFAVHRVRGLLLHDCYSS